MVNNLSDAMVVINEQAQTIKVLRATNDHTAIDDVYDKYKHLDAILEMPQGQVVTDEDDPLHFAARDMWQAIKQSADNMVQKQIRNECKSCNYRPVCRDDLKFSDIGRCPFYEADL